MELLYRKLDPKYKWDKYFPKTECNATLLGNGYTDTGVKLMKKWATDHFWQTKKLAKALKGSSPVSTLKNVHNFVYKNFQYKPDGELQHLLSPACAWKKREEGTNCKGYSIIASSILQNLKIPHVIRKVNYQKNTPFTHVFVVAKINGKEYIIDGTLPKFNFTTKYQDMQDLSVLEPNLSYVGLNAPQNVSADKKQAFVNVLKKHQVENIDQVLRNIPCKPGEEAILYPLGVKFGQRFVPFKFKGVAPEKIEAVTKEFFKRGMNGYTFPGFGGGSSFNSSLGPVTGTGNFGPTLNLGSGSGISDGSSGGGTWIDRNGDTIMNWANTLSGVVAAGSEIYNSITGKGNHNQVSGGNVSSNNSAGNNTQYGQNTGITTGLVPTYQPTQTQLPQPAKKEWYKNPLYVIPLAFVGGYTGYKLVSKKKQNK